MKIKKLEVCGFKSFVDRHVLKFDHDVTCVVGPNGCGKSNIVDAIRWVMGEQSAKNLRGRGMDDVIFAGSETRGPHGFAEVTITFDNSDHLAPPEYNVYEDIAVTRRLDRQGHSDYLINKTPVRLMDVTNLFLGTGVGRRAYSIIEQGRIGLIVSAKPQDRRHLIEEAAGITKFKAKKRAAERKMEHTQNNLLRVSDIITEIQKTLASLKRQAQKAERYKRYRTEIRELELWIASHRWFELTAEHQVLRVQLGDASASADGARLALRMREAELEAERLNLQGVEADVDRAQTAAYEADNSVKLLESQIAHHGEQLGQLKEREQAAAADVDNIAQQREDLSRESEGLSERLESLMAADANEASQLEHENAELERRRSAAEETEASLLAARGRVAEAEREIARADAMLASFEQRREESRRRLSEIDTEKRELRAKITDETQEADALRVRLEGLHSGKDELGKHRGKIEEELSELRQDIVTSDDRVEALRSEVATKRSRLHSLQEIQKRFEGVGAGVRAVMAHYGAEDADAGVRGLVADRFECPVELTKALAAALGEKLQYVVVDDLAAGVDAVRYLSEGKRGRATLIPRTPRSDRAQQAATPQGPGVVGPLMELVQVEGDDRVLAEHILGDVLVVDDLDCARRLHESGGGYPVLVTRDGHVLAADGTLSGGDGEEAGAHLIEVKREVRELDGAVAALDADMAEAMAHHGQLRNGIAQRQAALEAATADAHDRELAQVRGEKDLRRVEEAARAAEGQLEKMAAEADALSKRLDGSDEDETREQGQRTAALEAKTLAEGEVTAAEEVSRARRTAVDAQNAIVTETRVRAAQARQKLEGDQAAVERLARSLEELGARDARQRADIQEFSDRQVALSERARDDRAALEGRVADAMRLADAVTEVRTAYDAAKERLVEQELVMREVRNGIEADTNTANELSLREREVALALQHLMEGVRDKHRTDLRFELTDYHDREQPDEAVRERVRELTRIVERMGEINLTAIDDYEERSERHEYLTGQRDDLQKALDQLDKAIRQMNRKSRQMFRDTFHEVNTRFQTMFPRMFGGGRGELRLTEPDNLLESGIDIIAQPPGKKLTSIELMSGGEKALTAVSLIFAIFSFKPSPFCLLDEVDAPLDEANIERYCEMIRSMTDRSQFILISHSKTTMSQADVLYGVTMETPGISKLVAVEMKDESETASKDDDDDSSAAVA